LKRSRGLTTRNLIANYIGRVWIGVVTLAMAPVYIHYMGAESFGLIGVFMSIVGLAQVCDLGLSTTINKELSLLSGKTGSAQESRDLLRTFEAVYWFIGAVLAMTIMAMAPWLSHRWFHLETLNPKILQHAIMLMGLVLAAQWPSALYIGGLSGLERQVVLNIVLGIFISLEGFGGWAVLRFISPTITAFFLWQAGVQAAQVATLAICLWASLPAATKPAARNWRLWLKHWHFAAGMTGIAATVSLLTQMDKIVISKLLPLKELGYYTLAFTAATILSTSVSPIFVTMFPRFSKLALPQDEDALRSIYHGACQMVAIIMLPAFAVLAVFPASLLHFWIRDPMTIERVRPLVVFLATGTALNCLMTMPYALQISQGWTSLSFYKNIAALFVILPLMLILVRRLGASGAAISWIVLNAGYIMLEIPIMHSRLLKSEMFNWYFKDAARPAFIAFAVCFGGKWALGANHAPTAMIIEAGALGICAALGCLLSSPFARHSFALKK